MKKIPLFDNAPYMKGRMEIADDGTVTTFVETGAAASVLPFRKAGHNWEVLLMEQFRPEVNETILKTCGGYQKAGESPEDCVVRNLLAKTGFECDKRGLYPDGETLGYTVVRVPIKFFHLNIGDGYGPIGTSVKGISLAWVPINEAIRKALANEIGDDCAKEHIFRLAFHLGAKL